MCNELSERHTESCEGLIERTSEGLGLTGGACPGRSLARSPSATPRRRGERQTSAASAARASSWGGPCDLIEVLSVRKFVTQLVRRLPKKSADAVPEAAERLEVEQTQVAILLPREPVVALLVVGRS